MSKGDVQMKKNKFNLQISNYIRTINLANIEINKLQEEINNITNIIRIRSEFDNLDSYKNSYKTIVKNNNAIERMKNKISSIKKQIIAKKEELSDLDIQQKKDKRKIFHSEEIQETEKQIAVKKTELTSLIDEFESLKLLKQFKQENVDKIESSFKEICTHFNIELNDFYKVLHSDNTTIVALERKKVILSNKLETFKRKVIISEINIQRIKNNMHPVDIMVCASCEKCDAPLFCPYSPNFKENDLTISHVPIDNIRNNISKTKVNDF